MSCTEFTDHQRHVFCVFSGDGVNKLRHYLDANSATIYDNALTGPGGFPENGDMPNGLGGGLGIGGAAGPNAANPVPYPYAAGGNPHHPHHPHAAIGGHQQFIPPPLNAQQDEFNTNDGAHVVDMMQDVVIQDQDEDMDDGEDTGLMGDEM